MLSLIILAMHSIASNSVQFHNLILLKGNSWMKE